VAKEKVVLEIKNAALAGVPILAPFNKPTDRLPLIDTRRPEH